MNLWLSSAAAALALAGPLGQDESFTGYLLAEDGRVHQGELRSGEAGPEDEGQLLFSSPRTGAGVPVDLGAIRQLVRTGADGDPLPLSYGTGHSALTLLRSQRLHGRLTGWSEGSLAFESERFGALTIPEFDAGFLGFLPDGVDGSTLTPGAPWHADWERMEAVSDGQRGVRRTLEAPGGALELPRGEGLFALELDPIPPGGKLRVSLDVGWIGPPEFELRVATKEARGQDAHAVMDLWNRRPVLYSLTEPNGTLRTVPAAKRLPLGGSGLLLFEVSASELRLVSFQPDRGEALGFDLALPRPVPGAQLELSLVSRGQPLTIRDIRIQGGGKGGPSSTGSDPKSTRTKLLRADEIDAFDAPTRELLLDDQQIPLDAATLQFVRGPRAELLETQEPDDGYGRVTCLDGEAVELRRIQFAAGAWLIEPRWGKETARVPFEEVAEIRFPWTRSSTHKAPEFEFQEAGSEPLMASLAGITVTGDTLYLQRHEPGFAAPMAQEVRPPLRLERSGTSIFRPSRRKYPHEIVLHTGEALPAKVLEITPKTFEINTPFQAAPQRLPRAAVKAVFLDPSRARFLMAQAGGTRPITKARLHRALSVLRSQQDDPGTHLLLATNGDLLRTNLVGFDDRNLKLRVQGGSGSAHSVPLSLLAAWISIHPTLPDPGTSPKNSWRVTLGAHSWLSMPLVSSKDETLTFDHPILGSVLIHLDEIEILELEPKTPRAPYPCMDWVTRPIAEPATK